MFTNCLETSLTDEETLQVSLMLRSGLNIQTLPQYLHTELNPQLVPTVCAD